jgi:hypothetical protein
MTIDLRELQLFVKQCDPGLPLGDDNQALYVKLDEGARVRGDESRSCIDELERTVLLSGPSSVTCQLFTGFIGTGKTTELRRLRRRLADNKQAPVHAILVDFEQYINPYVPISITDVLRVLAYTLDREATLAEGRDPDAEPGYLRRLFEFAAHTDIDLQKIGFAQYGVSLMAELKENATFRQKIEAALALRFQLFAREATEVMTEAVVRLRRATHATQIVLIADGLEKIMPLREDERGAVEASVETLFVEHASWLRLPCHAIYTFPLWLRFRTAELDTQYDREAQILPMVKITEPDGTQYPAGFTKLTELIGKRLDLGRIFGANLEQSFYPLIAASGGYPRDLLRLVRECLWAASDFPVSPKVAQRVTSKLAEGYARTIRDADADILAEIASTHELPRGDTARLSMFGRLLQKLLVLGYRNGHEWYDLHPLVRRAPIVKERLLAASKP